MSEQTNLSLQNSTGTIKFHTEHISDIYFYLSELLTETLELFENKLEEYFATEQRDDKQLLLVKTISTYRKTDIESESNCTAPYWSYGVHPEKEETFLIGFLCVDDGFVVLKDCFTSTALILNGNCGDLLEYLNKFVLLENFVYFTENYRDKSINNVDYVTINLRDVKVLKFQLRNRFVQILHLKKPDGDFKFTMRFLVVKKFQINLSDFGKREFWLEIDSNRNRRKFISFDSFYLSIYPLLEIGGTYLLMCNEPLQKCYNKELIRLCTDLKMVRLKETDGVLVRIKREAKEEFQTVDSVFEALIDAKEPLCFEGVLKAKKFVKPLSSRTKILDKAPGFGTSGHLTHVLEFFNESRDKSLAMYMNNWEMMQNPIGIIPEAKIRVRWAVPQKNKYLKSTCMTTFEFLNYESPIEFSTCPLLSDKDDWGKKTYLGLGNLLPTLVLVWGRVSKLVVRSLKISHVCEFCDIVMQKKCQQCQNTVPFLKILLTCYIMDEMGQSMVISKSENLLQLLLNVEKQEWTAWLKVFKTMENYVYKSEDVDKLPNNIKESFEVTLATYISILNNSVFNLSLKCRKMNSSRLEDNEGCPLWYCVDAHKNRFY